MQGVQRLMGARGRQGCAGACARPGPRCFREASPPPAPAVPLISHQTCFSCRLVSTPLPFPLPTEELQESGPAPTRTLPALALLLPSCPRLLGTAQAMGPCGPECLWAGCVSMAQAGLAPKHG